MAYQYSSGYGSSSGGQAGMSAATAAAAAARSGRGVADEFEDDEDYDEDSFNNNNRHINRGDKIKRNYLQHETTNNFSFDNRGPLGTGEAIHVQLNEGYFSNEKKIVIDFLANVRSKLSSMQMFNPAKNQTVKEQQETWNDKVSINVKSLLKRIFLSLCWFFFAKNLDSKIERIYQ